VLLVRSMTTVRIGARDVVRRADASASPPHDGDRFTSEEDDRGPRRRYGGRVIGFVRRLRNVHPLLPDTCLAVLVAAFQISSAAVTGRARDEPNLSVGAVALILVQTLPLIWRTRHPLVVAVIAGAGAAAYGIGEYPDPLVPLGALVAGYTLVAASTRHQSYVGGALVLPIVIGVTAAAGDSDAADYYFAIVTVALTWTIGENQRTRAERLASEQAEATARAVAEERVRIARELHDVVAHHVGMMVVQSEAGAAGAPPGSVSDRFDAIGTTGRQALTELRRVLGVLREEGETRSLVPQPGIDRIEDLVRQVNGAGVPVDVRIEGAVRPLAPGVELSAYRIVQEALTNVVKHAGPAHANVLVRYVDDALEVEVTDDGCGRRTAADGHGLIGLRERVALFGGSLRAGERPGGGFMVAARLPVAAR
jgi:signal transduction histidine kinase